MQRDVENVEETYGAWGKRDLTSILLLMAQDVEVVPSPELPWGGEYSGHEATRQFFAVWAEHLDSRLLLERLIDAGDQVVAVGRLVGKTRVTQLEFDVPCVHVWRFHSMPAPPHVLEVCDELGMLVIDESAIYASWQMLMPEPPDWMEHCREHLTRWVRRDRNHPSVILSSAENEGLNVSALTPASEKHYVKTIEDLKERGGRSSGYAKDLRRDIYWATAYHQGCRGNTPLPNRSNCPQPWNLANMIWCWGSWTPPGRAAPSYWPSMPPKRTAGTPWAGSGFDKHRALRKCS